MSKILYASMFAGSPRTRAERRRAKRKRVIERMMKVAIYATAICSFTAVAENPIQYISVAGSICIALECFR